MTKDLIHAPEVLEAAQRWYASSEAERRRRLERALKPRDLGGLLEMLMYFVTTFHGRPEAATKKSYRQALNLLLGREDLNLRRLEPAEAAGFIRGLEEAYARATVETYLSHYRVLYAFLIEENVYKPGARRVTNPFARVKLGKRARDRGETFGVYTDKDLQRLLSAADLKVKAGILLGAHGGLRAAEMIELRWRDLELGNERLKVRRGKGNIARQLRMSPTLIAVLKDGRAKKYKSPLPYANTYDFRYALECCAREAGVVYKGKALHGLRHYCAVKGYQATRDLLLVQRHLGHKSVETTNRYARHNLGGFDDSYLDEFRKMLGQLT